MRLTSPLLTERRHKMQAVESSSQDLELSKSEKLLYYQDGGIIIVQRVRGGLFMCVHELRGNNTM
jgi:hypothetical protein